MKQAIIVLLFFLPLTTFGWNETEWIIDRLIECESGGNERAENWNDAKITGYPSLGLLQFQPWTFHNFGKQYGIFPPEFTLKESRLLIFNPSIQKAIAERMIEDGLWRHWKNCGIKIGLDKIWKPIYTRK